MCWIVLTLQTGLPAYPGAAQTACFVKTACFCNEQWYNTNACDQIAVLAFLKFWKLDFQNHNDLLVYIESCKHKVIFAYYSSFIYSIWLTLHQLQSPSYHSATCVSSGCRQPRPHLWAPSPSPVCSLHRGADPKRSSRASAAGGAHRLQVVA